MHRCWDGNPAQRMKAREALALLQELEGILSRKSTNRSIATEELATAVDQALIQAVCHPRLRARPQRPFLAHRAASTQPRSQALRVASCSERAAALWISPLPTSTSRPRRWAALAKAASTRPRSQALKAALTGPRSQALRVASCSERKAALLISPLTAHFGESTAGSSLVGQFRSTAQWLVEGPNRPWVARHAIQAVTGSLPA
jgi:hypothetical protein